MADLTPLNEQLTAVLGAAKPLEPVAVPVAEALGLVLAADIVARHSLPTTDNSAMDGYAVRAASVVGASSDAPVRLRVVADVPAGSGLDPRLDLGECARIMTGAPVPSTADAIVPLEATTLGTDIGARAPDEIEVTVEPKPGAHIRHAGEDVIDGELVVAAGTVLGARAASAAVAAGIASVLVVPRPRVAVITTGDELAEPGEPLERGRIHDSNTPLVAGLVAEAGATVVHTEHADDDAEAFMTVLRRAASLADVVVTTGGVSVGAFDVVRLALVEQGVTFTRVAMQPGKPQGFGRFSAAGPDAADAGEGPLVFCLPGNPVSVFVSFEAFVRPALRKLAGVDGSPHVERPGVAAEGWRCPDGRLQLMPVRTLAVGADGRATVAAAAAGGSGSHLVASLARADAIAVVPAEVREVRAGDQLRLWEVLP